MIKPEIGMPVLFHSGAYGTISAHIERVWNDGRVDLVTASGISSCVLLHQGDDGEPNPMGAYWCQFPNWFVRLMSPLLVVNHKALSGISVADLAYPQKIWQVAPSTAACPATLPSPSVDPVQCAGCQPTSQVLG